MSFSLIFLLYIDEKNAVALCNFTIFVGTPKYIQKGRECFRIYVFY